MTAVRDYLDARRDTLPALPDTVLAVLAREVTATDCHRAAEGGGYDVATLVDLAGRIVARELHAARSAPAAGPRAYTPPTPLDAVEQLAAALEEAAARVRMHAPARFEVQRQDHTDSIPTDLVGGSIAGHRSPVLRAFRIEW